MGEKVEVPGAAVWMDFLGWAGWLNVLTFNQQPSDWVRAMWNLYKLRVRYGDKPGQIRF
jgi:hypothetical protein